MKKLLVVAFLLSALAVPAAVERPTERLRGFNLLEMFIKHSDNMRPQEFKEDDFRMIKEWGFNFVRLPMDYRFWIKNGDWDQFDESALQVVDRAVALGRKYGIHVAICMHRIPGYTVAKPAEKTDLFKDPEPLRVAAKHWAMFARRYKGISSKELSFNLFNEPPDVKDEVYGRVAKVLVEAIRREDPTRFILADGLAWGNKPVQSLVGLEGVGQSTRGYAPMSVSHYLAPWVNTSLTKPPEWPLRVDQPIGIFAGPDKSDLRVPFVAAKLPPCQVKMTYGRVSGDVTVQYKADGKTVATAVLHPDDKDPAWRDVKYFPQWNLAQGTYTGTTTIDLPDGARELSVSVVKGDWMNLSVMTVTAGTKTARLTFQEDWRKPEHFVQTFCGFDVARPFVSNDRTDKQNVDPDPGREYLATRQMPPWDAVRAKGTYVIAGEFGVWHKTPHAITLDYLEDYLSLWKERNMGWALWEFRGTFGILDSGRTDVDYEDYRGHKLDRKMLELLRKY